MGVPAVPRAVASGGEAGGRNTSQGDDAGISESSASGGDLDVGGLVRERGEVRDQGGSALSLSTEAARVGTRQSVTSSGGEGLAA